MASARLSRRLPSACTGFLGGRYAVTQIGLGYASRRASPFALVPWSHRRAFAATDADVTRLDTSASSSGKASLKRRGPHTTKGRTAHVGESCRRITTLERVEPPTSVSKKTSLASSTVSVSAERLEQLLEAEITTLALREPKPLTLQTILTYATSGEDELGEMLHEELPVRFAQRIKMLEALPDWENKVSISSVRQMYVTSFKELRLADPRQPEGFQKQLRHIKQRHSQTNLLVGGFKQYAEDQMEHEEINEWLDRFFALRVSTNMLISHYLQMNLATGISSSLESRSHLDFDPGYNPYRSSIDKQCNAARIGKHAAYVVSEMSRCQYGIAPRITVQDCGSQDFPFVPRYLFYILSELLKNSVRATIETHCPDCVEEFTPGSEPGPRQKEWERSLPPISVVVSGDHYVSSLRVSDEGGGIPVKNIKNVWSYLYTTAEPVDRPLSRLAVDAPADLRRLLRQEAEVAGGRSPEEMQQILFRSPLAGLGCGLPLSRLYANYLGGSITLQTLPRHGTDVFVYLNRLGTSMESLPHL